MQKSLHRLRTYNAMKKSMLSLLLLYSILAYSQNSVNHSQIPKLIPPSPEVSSLFKFVDYPVSHSTGIPEISIPLYTVQCGNLRLPISINYHASGRKFSDITGPVGVGWILNAGGTISRTVFGYPDEDYPVLENQRSASSLNIKDDYQYLAELYYEGGSDPLGGYYDSEYDLFSYSLPSMSGSFVLYNGSPEPLTLNGIKINGTVDSFTITGEDGTQYTFRDYGNSSVSASYVNYYINTKTSWFLNEIKSADGKHTISLTYEGVKLYDPSSTQPRYPLVGETMIVNDLVAGDYLYAGLLPVESQNMNMEFSFSSLRLKEINFGSGKVVFENEAIGGKLKKIYIRDASGATVKTYSLTQTFLDHTILDNYKLTSITTISGNDQTDTYRFDYYPTAASFKANQHDYWGYINDNVTASSNFLIPAMTIAYDHGLKTIGHKEVTREANESKMKSGVLKKISYPTGGSTEFIYEVNKFRYGLDTRKCGGLRIKQIKTMDDAGQIQLRTFEYNSHIDGQGWLKTMQNVDFWGFESLWLDVSGSMTYPNSSSYKGHYRQRVFPSEFPQDQSYYANQPIFYDHITEYIGDGDNNTGQIIYLYDDPFEGSSVYNMPSPSFQEISSPHYPHSMPKNFKFESDSYRYISQYGSLWKDRNLISQTEYEKIDGVYKKVKSTEYTYTDVTEAPLTGLKIFKYIQIKDDYGHQTEEFVARDLGLPVFLFADYSITRGRRILSSVTEDEVLGGHTVTTTRHYSYDSNFLLKSVMTSDSSGNNQLEETFYPTDAEYKGQAVYAKMVNLNMLNVPLRQTLTRNGKSRSNLTAYLDLGRNCIKPFELSTRKDNNDAEVRIRYNKYDNYGNPVHVVKDNVLNVVYLWGYNGMYPVAEITNATYSEVQAALGTVPESVSSSDTYDSRIDNLRAKLPQAQVTTYKYKRLVGHTSVTDPAGLTTFYTYDAFNRLQKISVQEPGGSIRTVGTHDYHYKNN